MNELVTQLVIDSAYAPRVIIDKPLSSDAVTSGPSSWILGVLKPQITVVTPLGNKVIAPWGAPGETRWPIVQWILIALMACLVIGTAALL
jgi:hypothetical protein